MIYGLRCMVSGNLCGTDTWITPCQCAPCQQFVKQVKSIEPINMPIIIGLGHRARHGKDTVAKIIYEHHCMDYKIEVTSFGAALKREVNACAEKSGGMRNLFDPGLYDPMGGYLQVNGNFLPLPEWVQYDPNPPMDDPLCPYGKQRTLLQWWGTEYRRSIDPNYWVDRTVEHLSKSNAEIALITDLRFPNEFEFVRKYGAAIKVIRPDVDSPNAHYSETALSYLKDHEWDAVIYNDSTLEDLEKQTLYVFEELMEERQKASR